MTNLILFLNSFLSYLLVFVVMLAIIVTACLIGVKMRKNKDAKNAALQVNETESRQEV